MQNSADCENIDRWLEAVRAQFVATAPDLSSLFEVYAAEARFGRQYIASSLDKLSGTARIIEIGAGAMLLSCQLVREGYDVTALEPIGAGFSHFDRMRAVVLLAARVHDCCPEILECPAESMSVNGGFDFAFSVNVMEHVGNVGLVLQKVGMSLNTNGTYQFTCPNYSFPYEPHFNLPTLVSKAWTEKILGKFFMKSGRVIDAPETWRSLNWITTGQVIRSVKSMPELSLTFNKAMLVSTLERVVSDRRFASRRSRGARIFLGMLVASRMHVLLRWIPVRLQPIMDCSIKKHLRA